MAKKSDLIFPFEETPASEKLRKSFTQVLHVLDNNEMAKALHFCEHFDHTCCIHVMKLFNEHKMSSLILKYILLLDQKEFDNVCCHITGENNVKDISHLYLTFKSFSLTTNGRLYFTGGIMDSNDYYTYLKNGDHCLISLQFFNLVEHLHTMIDNPRLFLKHCQKVMASKTCSIPYFSEDNLKGFFYHFKNFEKNSRFLLRVWNCFWTWSDHSILKELLNLGDYTGALKLLDVFDHYLDSLKSKPIASFKFPLPSNKMIPSAANMYTVLAIKYNKLFKKCTLQNIFELRQSLIRNCEITLHALQLLSVTSDNSECTLVFWMIPKCIVSLMNAQIPAYRDSFNQDIAEISIYPSSLFTISRSIEVGPLAFITCSPECAEKEMQLLTLNEELSDMKSRVMTKTLQYQQVVEEKRQLIKRIRHLESATSGNVKMAAENTRLADKVQDLKSYYDSSVEIEKLEMLKGFSKDEKIQHVEKISAQHKRMLRKIHNLRTVSYVGKARIFVHKSCMTKKCYEKKSVYYVKKISASSLKSSKSKSASNATKSPRKCITYSSAVLGCATKSAYESAAYAYMSTFSTVFYEKIIVSPASNVLRSLQGSGEEQQQHRKNSGDSTDSVVSQVPSDAQERDEEKNREQLIPTHNMIL
ncbi:uncharacterized protein [Dysidea avara]|uniref:uncharacterized protein isoform X2 n=1 Tax=Dysidea avara TaxID=196820 RepID=UPI003322D24C